MSEPTEWMSPSIRITQLEVRANEAEQEAAKLRAEVERLRSALIRLRDCDWVITPHDRMDAVRDIARHALEPLPVSDRVEIDHVPGVRKMVER